MLTDLGFGVVAMAERSHVKLGELCEVAMGHSANVVRCRC
jgi:hypothetical protein